MGRWDCEGPKWPASTANKYKELDLNDWGFITNLQSCEASHHQCCPLDFYGSGANDL